MSFMSMELISLVFIFAILLDYRYQAQRSTIEFDSGFVQILLGYTAFLILSVITHGAMQGYLRTSTGIGRFLALAHIASFPALILHWMLHFERDMLRPSVFRIVASVKIVSFLIFFIVLMLDFYNPSLFVLDKHLRVVAGFGMYIMVIVGSMYCVTALIVFYFSKRYHSPSISSMFVFVPAFMAFSLVLFTILREHDIFTIGASFMLLLIYFFLQHRRLEIDSVTKTPNQNGFLRYAEMMIEREKDTTLLVIDIENFRLVLEHYGNARGNQVLTDFAGYLKNLKQKPLVFRIGGNRFVLGFSSISHNEVVRLVHYIQKSTNAGWSVENEHISFHVNVGVLEIPIHARSTIDVLDAMDFLITEIQSRKRQSVLIYNRLLTRVRERQLNILTALRSAISSPEHVLIYFQPIYKASSNELFAAEALMRIEDPQLGLLMPGEFIPIAEKSGLIGGLTQVIVGKVCQFLVEQGDKYPFISYVSINIAAEDFATPDTAQQLLDIVIQSKVNPHTICFEMTESELFSSFHKVEDVWHHFIQKGVRFALDDFGTGYANLESLINVPFDIVKIDRSVVSNSSKNFALINLISVMISRLQKTMIAEGVETQEQLDFVQAAGIDLVQGYYYAKPVPKNQFLDMLHFESSRLSTGYTYR